MSMCVLLSAAAVPVFQEHRWFENVRKVLKLQGA
jgi:hypothetical protein